MDRCHWTHKLSHHVKVQMPSREAHPLFLIFYQFLYPYLSISISPLSTSISFISKSISFSFYTHLCRPWDNFWKIIRNASSLFSLLKEYLRLKIKFCIYEGSLECIILLFFRISVFNIFQVPSIQLVWKPYWLTYSSLINYEQQSGVLNAQRLW